VQIIINGTVVATFPPDEQRSQRGRPSRQTDELHIVLRIDIAARVFRPASVTTAYPTTESTAIPLGAEFAGSEIVVGVRDGCPAEVNGLLLTSLED